MILVRPTTKVTMRIKEDSSSWGAHSVIRRDFRNSHDEPEIPGHKKKSKGSKSKYCKGRKDTEHDFSVTEEVFMNNKLFYTIAKCSLCGRHGKLNFVRGFRWGG